MEGAVARFAARLAEQAGLWALGAILVAQTPAWPAGVVLLGIVYARNLEFMHECLHATALPRPRANALFGQLLGVPMLVSFARWRREHMAHHADVRLEGFRYDYARLTTWREYAVHALMLRHFGDALARLATLDRRYRAVLAAVFGIALLSLALHSWLPALLWIAPLPIAAIVHTHIELPEHLGRYGGSDPLRTSRVIPAGRLLTWFVNANNYHAIHHWRPRLPMTRLAAVFATLPPGTTPTTSYSAFYRTFWKNLAR